MIASSLRRIDDLTAAAARDRAMAQEAQVSEDQHLDGESSQ